MKNTIFTLLLGIIPLCTYSQVGINTSNPQDSFHIDAGKNNPPAGAPNASQQKDDFIVTSDGRIGIGTTTPAASAILDVNTDNQTAKKGFLPPRLNLTNTTDQVTVPDPKQGMMVYHLGQDPSFDFKGLLHWNGSAWMSMGGKNPMNATITGLGCSSAIMYPSTYKAGEQFFGSLSLPFTGGNGGVYAPQTIGPVNGLMLRLKQGNLDEGASNLVYTITGIPTVSSPTATTFPITFAGKNCTITIGNVTPMNDNTVAYEGRIPLSTFTTSGSYGTGLAGTFPARLISTYLPDLPVIEGKVRPDLYFYSNNFGTSGAPVSPRIYNVSGANLKLWYSAYSTIDKISNSNVLLANGAWVNVDNGLIYLNYGNNSTTTTPTAVNSGTNGVQGSPSNGQEVETVQLVIQDSNDTTKRSWYTIYYFPYVDNKGTASTTDDEFVVNISYYKN